jgi:hypothetical protein
MIGISVFMLIAICSSSKYGDIKNIVSVTSETVDSLIIPDSYKNLLKNEPLLLCGLSIMNRRAEEVPRSDIFLASLAFYLPFQRNSKASTLNRVRFLRLIQLYVETSYFYPNQISFSQALTLTYFLRLFQKRLSHNEESFLTDYFQVVKQAAHDSLVNIKESSLRVDNWDMRKIVQNFKKNETDMGYALLLLSMNQKSPQ